MVSRPGTVLAMVLAAGIFAYGGDDDRDPQECSEVDFSP
jgi:hypothetical protein